MVHGDCFNPRTPCGVRLLERGAHPCYKSFNPRTPCGVRPQRDKGNRAVVRFQSTHSLRSATSAAMPGTACFAVSIHALLAECDYLNIILINKKSCFNPRTPCGVRRRDRDFPAQHVEFQSTHSLRSATLMAALKASATLVSIHALLAECDVLDDCHAPVDAGFNPRTPCGVRLCQVVLAWHQGPVSIHALLAECDKSE